MVTVTIHFEGGRGPSLATIVHVILTGENFQDQTVRRNMIGVGLATPEYIMLYRNDSEE